jgi:homoserine kinase
VTLDQAVAIAALHNEDAVKTSDAAQPHPAGRQTSPQLAPQRKLVGCEVVVPGSTSNLGPGFDALGLALGVYLRARIVAAEDDGAGRLHFTFDGLSLAGENSIERALRAVATRRGTALPSLDIAIRSDIPLKAGLGSSAAAIVAGIRLYEAIAGPLTQDDVLTLAAELEGHPDNTSASILGGLTASCQADGRVIAIATRWPEDIRVIVATPAFALETKVARAALPASIGRKDVVFNLQRVAVLLQAIHAGRYDALREALGDRLHQPYRAPLVPGLEEALAFEHPALLGVFLSGAGPSIAALTRGDAPAIVTRFERLYRDELGLKCTIRTLEVHQPEEQASGSGLQTPGTSEHGIPMKYLKPEA